LSLRLRNKFNRHSKQEGIFNSVMNIAIILMSQWLQKAVTKTGNCSTWPHCNNVPLHNKAYDSTSDKHCTAVSLNFKQAGKLERLTEISMHKVQVLMVSAVMKFRDPVSMPFSHGCGGSAAILFPVYNGDRFLK
jgi:hypothetical protein